jgi:3-oxoacyl-[acyl-carrier protein] reductase/2-hydroxycyclohexanecarboxyl-CoA dehydrogenase
MNPIAVVTGAQRGIGYGISSVLSQRGYTVVLCDVDEAGVRKAAQDLPGSHFRVLDVQNFDAVAEVVKSVEETIGPIAALVNNAGINRDRMLHRLSESEWDEVLNVNLKGQFNCLRHVAPLMRQRRFGRIVNISSASWQGNVGQANYAASKAGVIGLTKTAARELAAFNVTVNAICPGFIDSPMTRRLPPEAFERMMAKIPMGRIGTPEDVGRVVAFLVSEDAGYVTGEVINVGGGMVL